MTSTSTTRLPGRSYPWTLEQLRELEAERETERRLDVAEVAERIARRHRIDLGGEDR